MFIAFNGPVFTWLRSSVISVLNYKETSILICANHEGEMTLCRWRTCILSAEVNKVWTRLVSPVLFVNPVALLVSVCILKVKMINVVCKPKLLKVVVVHVG